MYCHKKDKNSMWLYYSGMNLIIQWKFSPLHLNKYLQVIKIFTL